MDAAEKAKLEAWLNEAELALHKLSLGASRVNVRDQAGAQVAYQPADADKLRAYIRQIKSRLGLPAGRRIAVGV